MCGLFGLYSSYLTVLERQMFEELGIISSLRGIDSTGVVIGSRKKKNGQKVRINQIKEVMNPTSFFNEHQVRNAIKVDNAFLLAGHCRAATSGLINHNNAHPVQHKDIILMHNGTITKWEPDKASEGITSDSRVFAEKISSLGAIPAFQSAEPGAYAVTAIDTQKKTLTIGRNIGRTLYCVFTKDGEVMMWASEADFLELVLKRNGVRHNWSDITLFPPMAAYTWRFDQRPDEGVKQEFTLFDHTKYATKFEKAIEPRLIPKTPEEKMQEWFASREGKSIADQMGIAWNAVEEGYDDETAEQSEGESPFKDDEKSAKGQIEESEADGLRTDAGTQSSLTIPGLYCRKCTEMLTNCKCRSPVAHTPFPWELDSKGRWIPEAAAAFTGNTTLGRPAADSLIRTNDIKDPVLRTYLTKWHGEADNDTYLGFNKQPMAPSEACERLKGGCAICGAESDPTDTVFWYNDFGHVCEFHGKPERHQDYLGVVSTFKSRYIKGEVSNVVH